eukprot:scaffold3068_cov401-Prasinococcus_capsulatus_cf.AAC.13
MQLCSHRVVFCKLAFSSITLRNVVPPVFPTCMKAIVDLLYPNLARPPGGTWPSVAHIFCMASSRFLVSSDRGLPPMSIPQADVTKRRIGHTLQTADMGLPESGLFQVNQLALERSATLAAGGSTAGSHRSVSYETPWVCDLFLPAKRRFYIYTSGSAHYLAAS